MSLFRSQAAAARTAAIRRRILDEKEFRGLATTDALALITQYRSLKASEGLPRRIRRGLRTRDRLDALRRTNLVYPTVGVCWHAGTPADLTSLAVELISKGYSTPAFFGDETIRRGLLHYGVPPPESRNYINSTCVEITPVGSSNVWVASPYFSTCQILLEEIAAQAVGDKVAATFDDFLGSYLARLSGKIISEGVIPQNGFRERRRQHGGKPLQSVFTADCVGRGLDIDEGGARYNWVECSFVGLANLADSLAVIRAEVFDLKTIDFKTLKKTLDNNFKDEEPLRQHFLKGHPKYGNADSGVDGLVAVVIDMKFNSSLFDSPESVKRLENLLVTYLCRGGFEVQVNVVNPATLRTARTNPEQYRDLVVRIGGYTDYFVNLSPGMQEEVMMRTEYGEI